jgi:hypothetical protein
MGSEQSRQERWWKTHHVVFEASLRNATRKPYDLYPADLDKMMIDAEREATAAADRMHGALNAPLPKDKLAQLMQATQALVRFCNGTGHPDPTKQGQLQQLLIVAELAIDALQKEETQ